MAHKSRQLTHVDLDFTAVDENFPVRKHKTAPDMLSYTEQEPFNLERSQSEVIVSPGDSNSNCLSLLEKIVLLSYMNKSMKHIDRALAWACLYELVFAERISTYECDVEIKKKHTKGYAAYIFNKKTTGDEPLDEVLVKIRTMQENGIKSIYTLMYELENGSLTKNIRRRISSQLMHKGFLKIKRSVKLLKYEKYDLKDLNGINKIKAEVQLAAKSLALGTNTLEQPLSMLALLSLLSCHANLKKEVLEGREIKNTILKLMAQATGKIVGDAIHERIYHIATELYRNY
jgi:hypothetical protein